MFRSLGLRVRYFDDSLPLVSEYQDCIIDLIHTPEIQRLADYSQHMDADRLLHSLHVSYVSFLVCHRLGLDSRAAARGGLLHDFFTVCEPQGLKRQFFTHPRHALQNAEKLTALSPLERDIIVKHMFPCTPIPPKHRESFIVNMVDTACALGEAAASLKRRISRRKLRA